jgi:hypothetical protein
VVGEEDHGVADGVGPVADHPRSVRSRRRRPRRWSRPPSRVRHGEWWVCHRQDEPFAPLRSRRRRGAPVVDDPPEAGTTPHTATHRRGGTDG